MPTQYCVLFEHAVVCTAHSCVAKTGNSLRDSSWGSGQKEGRYFARNMFPFVHVDFILWLEYYISLHLIDLSSTFARFSNCLYQRATNARREGKHRYLDVSWKTNDIFVPIREPIRTRPEFDGGIRAHFFLAKCNPKFPTKRSWKKLSISRHELPIASFFKMALNARKLLTVKRFATTVHFYKNFGGHSI